MDDKINEIKVSNKYRNFLISGIGRILLTRITSVIYIILLVRYVPLVLQDYMIIINNFLGISATIGLFGIGYSLTQKKISTNVSNDDYHKIIYTIFILGSPINVISVFIIKLYVEISNSDLILLIFTSLFNYSLFLIYVLNDGLIKSELTILAKTIYSVLNSLLVPTFFILFDSFNSILLAWNFSMLIALISSFSTIKNIVAHLKFDFKNSQSIIKFGFPVYLTSLLTIVSQRLDTFILYLFYETGETSQYYWVLRIAQVCQELFFSIFTGLFPILTKIFSRNNQWHYNNVVNSFLRVINFSSAYFFGILIVSSEIIIRYILGYEEIIYFRIIKYAFLAYILSAIAQILITSSLAQGKTKTISIGSVISNSVRTISLLLFYNTGPMVFVIILVFQQIILSAYYIFAKRSILSFNKQLVRNFIYLGLLITMTFFVPIGATLPQSILYLIIYLLLTIFLGYIIKPLSKNDLDNISNIIGDRFNTPNKFLKQIFVI